MTSNLDDELFQRVDDQQFRKRNRAGSDPTQRKKSKLATNLGAKPAIDVATVLYPLEGIHSGELLDREHLLAMTELERETISPARLNDVQHLRDRAQLGRQREQQLVAVDADAFSPAEMQTSHHDHVRKREPERGFGIPEPDLGTSPLSTVHLSKISLKRQDLIKHSSSPWFTEIVTGAWVRCRVGDKDNQPLYRLFQIKGISATPVPYHLDGRTIYEDLDLQYANCKTTADIHTVSNSPPTPLEFQSLWSQCVCNNLPMLTREQVDRQLARMNEQISRPVTEADIANMVRRRQRLPENAVPPAATVPPSTRARRSALNHFDARLAVTGEPSTVASRIHGPREQHRFANMDERIPKGNLDGVREAEMSEGGRKSVSPKKNRLGVAPALAEPKSTPTGLDAVIDSIEVDLGDF
ncbi:hypothetical protein FB451DRAFT_1570652 [Mycena latifolia]|nr:hypothetical protein FB451DRAFT_1570652 [Mycena latifolia]